LLASTAIFALVVNGIAYMQARAMTNFIDAEQRTPSPERLSLGDKVWAILAGVTVPRPSNQHTPSDIGLAYTTQPIIASDGVALETWFVPHPASHGIVIMFHAYASSKESLLAPAAALHDLGYDLLLVDFRGSGGSSGRETSLGVREGTDVARAVAYVQRTWPGRPIALYGVSMGAAAILRAIAVEGVKPTAIVLESPFDRLLTTVRNRFRATGLPAFPGAELVVFWGSVQQRFNGFAHNPVDYATSVTCPTLLLVGENDTRVTIDQATSIFNNLHEQKEFVRFPAAGHELLINADSARWKQRVGRFLNQIEHTR
jgi:alpha-beta hydrolase superfamily lysophospholipase